MDDLQTQQISPNGGDGGTDLKISDEAKTNVVSTTSNSSHNNSQDLFQEDIQSHPSPGLPVPNSSTSPSLVDELNGFPINLGGFNVGQCSTTTPRLDEETEDAALSFDGQPSESPLEADLSNGGGLTRGSSGDVSRYSNFDVSESEDDPDIVALSNQVVIDTAAPIESVRAAVSKFGGITDWRSFKIQTVENQKVIEQELEKLQEEIPLYRKKSHAAEETKANVLKDLESTKRVIEELKLNFERAQTEERQAKQDFELAELRVEEIEQGIAEEARLATKAQLEVARSRHAAAISELQSINEDLETLRNAYSSLLEEKEVVEKRAEEAVSSSKEIEKKVEDLTVELIMTKESLESAHAAHLEAEEQRMLAGMDRDQEIYDWDKEINQVKEAVEKLNKQIPVAKEHKSKLDAATSLLTKLKAELAACADLKQNPEANGDHQNVEGEQKSQQTAILASKKELEKVKANIEKVTEEVNSLKAAATSLKSELQKEKSELSNLKQKEGMASATISSLQAELEKIKYDISVVELREKEAKERAAELPKQLLIASQEAEAAKSAAEAARESLRKAKEEAEQAKAGASTMERQLLAAQKEIKAARKSENLAMAAMKALQGSELTQATANKDLLNGLTLSMEENCDVTKQACEAEEQANMKLAAATAQIEAVKKAEAETIVRLAEVSKEVVGKKEAYKSAMDEAEKAKERKLEAEQELRKWRAEQEQRKRTGDVVVRSPRRSVEDGLKGLEQIVEGCHGLRDLERVSESSVPSVHHGQGLKCLEHVAESAPAHIVTSPKVTNGSPTTTSPKVLERANTSTSESSSPQDKKKKKRSYFPRFLTFFTRKKK